MIPIQGSNATEPSTTRRQASSPNHPRASSTQEQRRPNTDEVSQRLLARRPLRRSVTFLPSPSKDTDTSVESITNSLIKSPQATAVVITSSTHFPASAAAAAIQDENPLPAESGQDAIDKEALATYKRVEAIVRDKIPWRLLPAEIFSGGKGGCPFSADTQVPAYKTVQASITKEIIDVIEGIIVKMAKKAQRELALKVTELQKQTSALASQYSIRENQLSLEHKKQLETSTRHYEQLLTAKKTELEEAIELLDKAKKELTLLMHEAKQQTEAYEDRLSAQAQQHRAEFEQSAQALIAASNQQIEALRVQTQSSVSKAHEVGKQRTYDIAVKLLENIFNTFIEKHTPVGCCTAGKRKHWAIFSEEKNNFFTALIARNPTEAKAAFDKLQGQAMLLPLVIKDHSFAKLLQEEKTQAALLAIDLPPFSPKPSETTPLLRKN
jgi:hypothetical protein